MKTGTARMRALPEPGLALRTGCGEAPFPGGVLLVAPHMDDETLGCGALIAGFGWLDSLHVAFATDGARSPAPRQGCPERELPVIRRREALDALGTLGLPPDNVHFFDLPDGELRRCHGLLRDRLLALIARLRPAHLLVPFRYDRHPDHLTVNRVTLDATRSGELRGVTVVEYFVYMKWRLLRTGDVRAYVPQERLLRLEADGAAARKRRALECYRSQTTRFYAWQKRPILTSKLLDTVCAEPEMFLVGESGGAPHRALARGRAWVPVAHRVEPVLKRGKDRVVEWLAS